MHEIDTGKIQFKTELHFLRYWLIFSAFYFPRFSYYLLLIDNLLIIFQFNYWQAIFSTSLCACIAE